MEGLLRAAAASGFATSALGVSAGGVALEMTSRSMKEAALDPGPGFCRTGSFRGDAREALLGGGATGSFFTIGLIRGGGTKSRSSGRAGSMGGRLLSGGAFSSWRGCDDGRDGGRDCDLVCGGVGRGVLGGSEVSLYTSPNRPNAPGPVIPFRDRGGKLATSSLLVVLELAMESWLLLFCDIHRGVAVGRSLEVVESKLPPGELVPFGRARTGGVWVRSRAASETAVAGVTGVLLVCWVAVDSDICGRVCVGACRLEAPST